VKVEDAEIATRARALAHRAGLRIVRLLQATPGRIGGDIAGAVGLARSTVSEHVRILKAAGIIAGELDGRRVCAALDPSALAPLAVLTRPPEAACRVPEAAKA
jgi:ArsR family transcriptional regulator, arsenate/arsenite/antimonite-responsive transcriptional repressor